MSDRDTLQEMLTRAGVVFEEQGDKSIFVNADDNNHKDPDAGYGGFYTVFRFNEAGDLESVSAWE